MPWRQGLQFLQFPDNIVVEKSIARSNRPASDFYRLTEMNLREIAERAKVSIATVSRTINRVPTVDRRLAKRVRKVIEEVGYYPNKQAQGLVSGHSRTFGLIVSEITNPFFAEIVECFEGFALRHNYEMLLSSTARDLKRMQLAVRRMFERRVEGVAMLTFGMEDCVVKDFRSRRVPLVLVDVASQVPGIVNIRIDYKHGIRQAVEHLAALRHVNIAFVMGPAHLKTAIARRAAFEESMKEIGIEVLPGFIVAGDHTVKGGMCALTKLAELPEPPTAVLCSNDMTAIGVLRQGYELGIAIPHELSVVGFDDIRLAQFTLPTLTTVQISQQKLAQLAFNALLGYPGSDMSFSDEYVLTTNLILRNSTILRNSRPVPI